MISFLSREHMNPQLTCSQRQWLHASLRNCISCVNCDHHFFISKEFSLHLYSEEGNIDETLANTLLNSVDFTISKLTLSNYAAQGY